MKKTLILLSLLLISFLADANPLFFPASSTIVVKGKYEYFYDSYGNLLGCEEIGSSGMVYCYLGNGEWDEEGYFIEENDWCLYYCTWLDNAYVGKVKSSTELFKDLGSYFERESRFYVDEKNRPVATYYERLTGQIGDDIKTILGTFENMLNPLGALLNDGQPVKHKVLVLNGKVRIYNN
jgi:hypothetical protein